MSVAQSYCSLLLDVLGGYGVMALVINNGSVHLPTVCAAAVTGLIYAHFMAPKYAFHNLCNTTLSLILTLSLCLHILQSVSSQSMAFMPVYILLCIPRAALAPISITVCCLLTSAMLIYCILPHHPETEIRRAVDPTSLFLHVFFAVANDTSFHILGCMQRKSSIGRFIKAAMLILLLTRNSPLRNVLTDTASKETAIYYSILLLFQSMLAAASWFSHLQCVLLFANKRTLLRIQHIFYALLVAAAWAFPWNMNGLRIFVIVIYTFTSVFMNLF